MPDRNRNRKPPGDHDAFPTDADGTPTPMVVGAKDRHTHDGEKSTLHRDGDKDHHHENGKMVYDGPPTLAAPAPPDDDDAEEQAALAASIERHPASGQEPTGPAAILPDVDPSQLSPEDHARLKHELLASLAFLDQRPPPTAPPAIPAPSAPTTGRLGTDLGGLELVQAGFRALIPGAPDGLDKEWALTMGAADLIGQMLNQHRRPSFADPALIAALRTLVEQIDQDAAARAGLSGG